MPNAGAAPITPRPDEAGIRRRAPETGPGRIVAVAAIALIAAACSSAGVTPSPTPVVTPIPTTTLEPGDGTCRPGSLTARVTAWEGAAGSRIAAVELTNTSASDCTLPAASRPALVDASGSVLIEGSQPAGGPGTVLVPGAMLTTSVRASNYCGADPVTPLSIAILLPGGGRVVADPLSPTDTTVPPCMGDAGSPGSIEMQGWARSV